MCACWGPEEERMGSVIFTYDFQEWSKHSRQHVQEQLAKMVSQCQRLALVLHHNSEKEHAVYDNNSEMSDWCSLSLDLCQLRAKLKHEN